MLTACSTPLEQPFLPDTSEPEIRDNALFPGDASSLPIRRWLPINEPKAVVIGLHGFNDYSNAFEGAGKFLRARGIALYAYDQRGFGANEDKHGIWGGEANLTRDVAQAVKAVRALHPDIPLYILGESMGGAVAIASMAAEDAPDVAGVILSAPAVWGDETMNGFYRATLWLMAHTAPSKPLTGEGVVSILPTDNMDILRAMGKDPLVIKESRVDAIYGIVKLMDTAYKNIEKVEVPMLFLYGANDQVIPRAPVSHAIRKVKAPYTLAFYPNGYHMLFRDLKGEQVLYDMVSWMQSRYTPLPSGYDLDWESRLAEGR